MTHSREDEVCGKGGEQVKIKRCHIENFTVFEKQNIEFCEGVNVIIGANGTGKSHLLKVLYSLSLYIQGVLQKKKPNEHFLSSILGSVYKTETQMHPDLLRIGKEAAYIQLITDRIIAHGKLLNSTIAYEGYDLLGESTESECSFIAIPPNEVLSIYPGFVASYEKRELAFDQTYCDICKALSAAPLRQKSPAMTALVARFEEILRGKVVLKGDHFYVVDKDTGKAIEAHLMAEGHRKLATLVHLINNGSIEEGSILLWDEPEGNMNPKLIKTVADFLRGLAEAGVQVFVATHDYLLTSELSLAAKYQTSPKVPIRFFAMSREGDEPVSVQAGDTLADLSDNPILDEFAAHYDRERDLFYAESGTESGHD